MKKAARNGRLEVQVSGEASGAKAGTSRVSPDISYRRALPSVKCITIP